MEIKAAVAGTTAPRVLLEVDDSIPGKPYAFGGSSFGTVSFSDFATFNTIYRKWD